MQQAGYDATYNEQIDYEMQLRAEEELENNSDDDLINQD
jgi:hypothetical protein